MPTVMEALHCLRVAITVLDADQRLVFVNEHFSHLFRSLPPRRELAGLRYEELVRLEVARAEVTEAEIRGNIEDYVASRTAQLVEGGFAPRDILLADGRIIEIKARRTSDNGWIILWNDVTEARQNLSRLEAAIGLSADAFAFYDRSDRLALCNDEYAAISGAQSPHDFNGLRFSEVIQRAAERTIATPDRREWMHKRMEAHRVPAGAMTVELTSGCAYVIRDRATADGSRVVVFTDVTDHRRVEKALDEQTRALDDTRRALALSKAQSDAQANYLADLTLKLDRTAASADNAKTTLLRTISHELKTPLNAIIGFSDLLSSLADCVTPDQIREYAGLIHQGGQNLLKLLGQILDLTKISAGHYELRRQVIDVAGALWEARERVDERAYVKEISIDTDECDPDLAVHADENAFTAMLGHLVDNAVNFTQSGGTVRLSAEQRGDKVRIVVSDNGPGIAASELERILAPFEQGGRSTDRHESGAGLGLTLVKAFSELHDGTLTLESELGAGFTAVLELPSAD